MQSQYAVIPIGWIRSPCKDKFSIPRQAALVPALLAQVVIEADYAREEAFRELQGFSHIWLLSVFHEALRPHWQPTVRPPRLGGNARVGVFASRSPFRPNPIGLSLVELLSLENASDQLILSIKGCDLLDGTPIIDIKPYLPYADTAAQARVGYVQTVEKPTLAVVFSREAQASCVEYERQGYADVQNLISGLLSQDPRPAYLDPSSERRFAFRLYDFDVIFHAEANRLVVEALRPIKSEAGT